ncbi:unnamed protein product [Paramecium pentaurelia]|uniref:THH1/TOM1/TOM3 domain-containing protein n=1 Tax=Paramecium pentaurelia TaxID=43138 RepID=A0A8S1SP31_9CILI|nr:unnamed protein product [Paramecium pentaurelia]
MNNEKYIQNLSDFITNDLEKAFAIIILMMNTIMILWQASNFHKLIRFYIKIMDPTLLKINTLLFVLSLIRIQAYSYAVFGCFLREPEQQLFQPSVFRTLQSSSFIFYDLVLGVIGAKWISIIQKFFNYFRCISSIEMIINLFLFSFWFACQIFLFVAESYHYTTWNQEIDKIYSILYFVFSLLTLILFVLGCILFKKHIKSINTINQKYKKYLHYSIVLLIMGQAIRLIFFGLRIWYTNFLIQFKYGFNNENTKDTTLWSFISFGLYLISDYIPTSILILIFYPNKQRLKQSLIVESVVEIE